MFEGTGMYSKVYMVQTIDTKEYFAMKVMPKYLAKKTRTETEVMITINHPFIVKLYVLTLFLFPLVFVCFSSERERKV
jgi:serine/threonine protein kinase